MCLKKFKFLLLTMAIAILMTSCAANSVGSNSSFGQREFEQLLDTVAIGWNTNDAALAASAFAEDALYSEPPDRQLYVGRDEIYSFFGGAHGRSHWMRMTWHNVSFNERLQIGAGEFTFEWPDGQVHGMVSIKVAQGLISRWREYFGDSELTWDEFQQDSDFDG